MKIGAVGLLGLLLTGCGTPAYFMAGIAQPFDGDGSTSLSSSNSSGFFEPGDEEVVEEAGFSFSQDYKSPTWLFGAVVIPFGASKPTETEVVVLPPPSWPPALEEEEEEGQSHLTLGAGALASLGAALAIYLKMRVAE